MNGLTRRLMTLLSTGFLASGCTPVSPDTRRAALVAEIERAVFRTRDETGRDRLDPRVIDAMATVPRHEFVPAPLSDRAYDNVPLPIGQGQTISEPYVVAMMTDLADVGRHDIVLEVGTGSGYQAAVLGQLARHVYTIEIIESLGGRASATLGRLGYENVSVKIGDGYGGWPEHAPFAAILVTAAPETVPPALVEQLAVGGRLVIPVGEEGGVQSLQVLEKQESGEMTTRNVLPVRFVPLTREE
jgi:protein-L-isoaspartate(D-aspartate) O-methyltransferase